MKKLGFVIAACSLLAACGGSSPKVISATTAAATTATRITVGSSAPASTVVVTNTTPTTSAVVATTTTTTTTTTVPRTTTTAAPKLMPDLSGKTTTDAKEVLAALGVNDVRLGERENIAAPGTVLDQVPSKGSTITGPVDLTVSKALSPMPDFSGKLIADARDYFKQRGVTVTAADQLDDTKPEGTIVASTPAAGESIGSEVKLTVVKKPVTQFLAKTANVEQRGPCSFSSNDVGVNGATQLQSLLFGVQSTNY